MDLKHQTTSASSSVDKAEMLNEFFTSCFSLSNPLSSSSIVQDSNPISSPSLSNIICKEDEVFNILSSYKAKTASGPDGVSSHMLRKTAVSISFSITRLFNLSLKQAKVPDKWKISNIIPIFKSGDPSAASNYRPISLLSLVSKIMERIIHNHLMDYLLSNHLMSVWFQAPFLYSGSSSNSYK